MRLVLVFPSSKNAGVVPFILLPEILVYLLLCWMGEPLNIHSSWRHVGSTAMQNLHFHFYVLVIGSREKSFVNSIFFFKKNCEMMVF